MNKVIDKSFRSCRFVSTIVKHPVCLQQVFNNFGNSVNFGPFTTEWIDGEIVWCYWCGRGTLGNIAWSCPSNPIL